MSDFGPSTRRRLLDAHYRMQRRLYHPEQHHGPDVLLVSHPSILDPAAAHAAIVRCEVGAWPELFRRICDDFSAVGRPPAIVVDPDTRPAELPRALTRAGWREVLTQQWLVMPSSAEDALATLGDVELETVGSGEDRVIVETVGEREAASCAAVYRRAFGVTKSGQRLGPDATRGWADAYRTSFGDPQGGTDPLRDGLVGPAGREHEVSHESEVELTHFAARVHGQLAGVATLIRAATGEAGLYNLAVDPAFRSHGIGRCLTDHRLTVARSSGCDLVFLQTEDPDVDRWQRSVGWRHAFTTVLWCPSAS